MDPDVNTVTVDLYGLLGAAAMMVAFEINGRGSAIKLVQKDIIQLFYSLNHLFLLIVFPWW